MNNESIRCMQLLGKIAKQVDEKKNEHGGYYIMLRAFNPRSEKCLRTIGVGIRFLENGAREERIEADFPAIQALYTQNAEEIEVDKVNSYWWFHSGYIGSSIDDTYTATEAASRWGLDESTVKKACQQNRFTEQEARKSGGTWIVTRSGMERVYGEAKQE
jgi:hypothetical protein